MHPGLSDIVYCLWLVFPMVELRKVHSDSNVFSFVIYSFCDLLVLSLNYSGQLVKDSLDST